MPSGRPGKYLQTRVDAARLPESAVLHSSTIVTIPANDGICWIYRSDMQEAQASQYCAEVSLQ